MRRYQPASLLASVLVAPALAGPGQSLDAICESTVGVYGCEEYMQIPYGSEPITTCFDTSPCGVQILTNNKNICDLVNETYIGGYTAYCHRAPDALRVVKTDGPVWRDGKLSGADRISLQVADGIEDEFDGRGFKFQNNKNTVLANQLANKDGWTVLKAPVIEMRSYYDIAVALINWEESGHAESQFDVIMKWFENWISRGTDIRNGKLATMLKDWEKVFATPYKNRITAIKTAASTVQTRVATVSSKVEATKKNICQNKACTGKTASTYLSNVSAALKAVKDLSNIVAAANSADEKRKYIYYNYLNNIQAPFTTDPVHLVPNNLVDLLDDKKLNTLQGLMHGFGTVTVELSMYSNDIKTNLTPLILLTKHESRVRDALKKINSQLTQNWKNNQELSKTASSRKVRDGFIQIQALLKKELQGSLNTLINAIAAFNTDFGKFPLRYNTMEIAWGAAPFDRWFNLEFDYPCRKQVTKNFTEAGFSKDFSWPVFSPCRFTAQKIVLPRGWIPYLKYRFVKNTS
ncbi:hypothetical protein FAVG1_09353 [Fusarium avenaceum]|nr:hypothetical protein FAVG1_09353 [Fusarium avenaceum]